jgi:hypothetical protein
MLRFPTRAQTATPTKMLLTPPKRTAAGYFLEIPSPVASPTIKWATDGKWEINGDWNTWADTIRATLLGELLSQGTWFSRPPRREVLEPLFSPWSGFGLKSALSFFCKTPDVPSTGTTGSATWLLTGILMSSTAISPVWAMSDVTEDDKADVISIFGDGETVDGDAEEDSPETKEIQLEEIADAPANGPATQLRSRDWEARKFLFKERVRESRLKAQIAIHMAHKEEARFFQRYGDLDDAESRFSDYDLSDTDTGSTSVGSDEEEQ